MSPNECTHLTPAQVALLDFASHAEASDLYQYLHTTLDLSITNYCHKEDANDPRAFPTLKALESWHFTLEMMQRLHDIAMEERAKGRETVLSE